MKPTRLEKYLIHVYKICCASGISKEVLIPGGADKADVLSQYQMGPHCTRGMVMEGLSNEMEVCPMKRIH